ncbi:hypothetical protein E4T52_05936 [Aureobasidium sp. EXF-3400]|nr:hypothetical protein E4T51_08601 [Aureobasidium sp. EXF-12344]KAI4779134.1 hypothetical protein E4T52_05936 [Aureobasidium sp. EXF-3400]
MANESIPEYQTDVLIVGSGPVGATYARKLVKAGIKVIMVEMGAQETKIPGEHKKNVINFQKNTNAFIKIFMPSVAHTVSVIQGELQKFSIPTNAGVFSDLNPESFVSQTTVLNGQNPNQDPHTNMEAAAATRAVGGMTAHRTCCTPEPLPGVERPDSFSDKEWERLFNEARKFIHTPIDSNGEGTEFENSLRQQLIKNTLREAFEEEGRVFKSMPLACKRREDNPDWVDWSSSATVFGPIISDNRNFELWSEHQCFKVLRDPESGDIVGAEVRSLRDNREKFIEAKSYVICAGAILTPQILFNSDFQDHLPALGRYMTEQPMTFCHVVLRKSLIDSVRSHEIAKHHQEKYPWDPLPFPFNDPDPQVTQPLTKERPWHTQIHRDAFFYGLVPDIYDQRTIVDLRYFGYVEPNFENRVEFASDKRNARGNVVEPGIKDMYGMPQVSWLYWRLIAVQPTFYFKLSPEDSSRADAMMTDLTPLTLLLLNIVQSMINVAIKLGGFLPGALPQFMVPGSAMHICGTTRAGENVEDSCVNNESRVHGSKNLFLGGCNVIPTKIACNPTLTAMCYGIVGAEAIIKDLKK